MASAISANKAELLAIANSVASEKMIDKAIVIEAMEEAIQKSARNRYGAENDIRGGWLEQRVMRRDCCGLRHQPGQHRRGRELLEFDLCFAANVPRRQGCFEPVERRFCCVRACRQIDV